MMSSSLRKLVVGSNIIKRSVNHFIKNTNSSPSNLFTRSAIQSRFISTDSFDYIDVPLEDLSYFKDASGHDVFRRFLKSKSRAWILNRSSHPDSSNAYTIFPSRVEESDECLYIYIELPGVVEENVKVCVEHNTAIIVGQLDKESQAKHGSEKYICWLELEYIRYKISDIKAEMRRNSEELKLTIPKLKPNEVRVLDVNVNFTD